MKRNKKVLVAAVAGALTAAAAVPAFALENEFHGTFTSYYDLSNFSAAGNDGVEHTLKDGTKTTSNTGLSKNAPTENYFVQRVRIGYNAKASDNVKLVTKFELDYTFLGNSSYTTGRNTGGGLGADSVNIETKHLYLDLTYPAVNAKIGMQAYNDTFKGILFDADMAGVLLSHDYSNASVSAGFFRFGDNGDVLGRQTNDMIALDAKYNVTKEFKVGASYYYINDNRANAATNKLNPIYNSLDDVPDTLIFGYTAAGAPIYAPSVFVADQPASVNDTKVHTIGLNAEALVGPVTLNGFAVAQFGDLDATTKAKGYAFNVGAKAPVLGGTARSEFIYVSGGKNAFFVPQSPAGSEGAALYDNEMIMLHRDKYAKTIDTALIYDVNNFNQGMIMGSVGYDRSFTDKLSGSVNAGFAAVADNLKGNGTSDYIGTELNVESNYKLNANTTLGVRGGYVILGDYFGPKYDNPYDFKILANYTF